MALEQVELEQIGSYVRENIPLWFSDGKIDFSLMERSTRNYDYSQMERIIRMEENQHTMLMRFEQIDKRFEQVIDMFEKRFDQVDKRFEQVDRRFEDMQHNMNIRFDQVDKRFEEIFHYTDKRFEDMQRNMDKRFEDMNKKFNLLIIIMGFGFTLTSALITIYRFLQ